MSLSFEPDPDPTALTAGDPMTETGGKPASEATFHQLEVFAPDNAEHDTLTSQELWVGDLGLAGHGENDKNLVGKGTQAVSDSGAAAEFEIGFEIKSDRESETESETESKAESVTQPEVEPEAEVELGSTAQGFLPVLKNLNFLTLWSGQVFSQLADKVYLVLMIALIANRFQAAGQTISGWVSAVMIAFTIPAVLFGSLAGVFVDRWRKKQVMVATNLLRGGLVFSLLPLLWLSQGWQPVFGIPFGFYFLLLVTLLVSTLTQFFAPAEQAAIPLIVKRRHLLSANSLYTTTMMASVIVGFAVGEPLLALADRWASQLGAGLGIGKELLVGSSYAIAGIILLLLRTGERIQPVVSTSSKVWQDLRDGLRYLKHQRLVRTALIQQAILFSIFAALAVLAVRLAEIIPELETAQFGVLLAAGGLGMGLGAALVGQFGQRFSHFRLAWFGSAGMAASLVGLAILAQHLWPALLLIACLGGFAASIGVPMQTTIQEQTPEAMRGKVFGLQNNAVNIALSLPLALAGLAEAFWGLRTVLLVLATLAIAGGGLTWYISRTGLKNSTLDLE